MILPAGFGSCSRCHRLLTVDGLNPDGRCTRDCGGDVGFVWRPAPTAAHARVMTVAGQEIRLWGPALDRMNRWPEEER